MGPRTRAAIENLLVATSGIGDRLPVNVADAVNELANAWFDKSSSITDERLEALEQEVKDLRSRIPCTCGSQSWNRRCLRHGITDG